MRDDGTVARGRADAGVVSPPVEAAGDAEVGLAVVLRRADWRSCAAALVLVDAECRDGEVLAEAAAVRTIVPRRRKLLSWKVLARGLRDLRGEREPRASCPPECGR